MPSDGHVAGSADLGGAGGHLPLKPDTGAATAAGLASALQQHLDSHRPPGIHMEVSAGDMETASSCSGSVTTGGDYGESAGAGIMPYAQVAQVKVRGPAFCVFGGGRLRWTWAGGGSFRPKPHAQPRRPPSL